MTEEAIPRLDDPDALIPRKAALRHFLGGCSNARARKKDAQPERYPNWPTPRKLPNGMPAYRAGDIVQFMCDEIALYRNVASVLESRLPAGAMDRDDD